jgi:hypothetical protein
MKRGINLIIMLGIGVFCAYAQHTIKIRSGLSGLDLPFSAYKGKRFYTLNSNKYFNVYKYKNEAEADFHAFIEYSYHKTFSVNTGYSNSSMGAGIRYDYLGSGDWPDTPETELGFPGGGNYISLILHRIPLYFTYSLPDIMNKITNYEPTRKRSFYFQPDILAGLSFMIFAPHIPRYSDVPIDFCTNDFTTFDGDYVYQTYDYRVWNNYNIGIISGINFRIGHKKREISSLSVYYEHGIRGLVTFNQHSLVNNTYLITNSISTGGSQVSLRLTFPVFSYNFTQKKFYRD